MRLLLQRLVVDNQAAVDTAATVAMWQTSLKMSGSVTMSF